MSTSRSTGICHEMFRSTNLLSTLSILVEGGGGHTDSLSRTGCLVGSQEDVTKRMSVKTFKNLNSIFQLVRVQRLLIKHNTKFLSDEAIKHQIKEKFSLYNRIFINSPKCLWSKSYSAINSSHCSKNSGFYRFLLALAEKPYSIHTKHFSQEVIISFPTYKPNFIQF